MAGRGEQPRRGDPARRRKRRKIVICACLVLCVLSVFVFLHVRRFTFGYVAGRLYRNWYGGNREAYEQFRELARAKGWKMYIINGDSIGILDFGHSTYDPLYSLPPRRQIRAITRFDGGRVAFIECRDKARWWRNTMELTDFDLRVLEEGGGLTKVPLDWLYLGRLPILMGDRCVVFGSGGAAYVYDTEAKNSRRVFTPKEDPPEGVVKVALVEGESLVVLLGRDLPGRLVVLEAKKPHPEISRMDGVSNMIVVGEHIVVEKGTALLCSFSLVNEDIVADDDGVCFLCDPEDGTTERLTAGNLVCSYGADEFLFCTLEQGNTSEGRAQLHRYRISSRSRELVWEPPAGDTGLEVRAGKQKRYDYTRLFLSPDGRFLFVPRHVPPTTHAELHLGDVLEYQVYDLSSGEKRGAFLNLYEGKFFFEFLGWDESKPGP